MFPWGVNICFDSNCIVAEEENCESCGLLHSSVLIKFFDVCLNPVGEETAYVE